MFDGARARALREQAGVSVESLAAAAQMSPNTIRSAETSCHEPSPRVITAIAAALGVPPTELATRCGRPTLRDIRRRLGLSQTEMAQRIGIGRQMVSRIERGVGGVRSPRAWAAAYGLTHTQWDNAIQATRDTARQKVHAKTSRRR
ncbi:helix-turn-helix transcriptional regulator [Streptomyces sp. NPDC048629]|uniref:helix-turn-helix transcriptional regulator n=1 Tax=Streptomyces sp. NPDC048629 TaxID=3154824 RepID=UPI00344A76DC